jgi:hypothetical protein
VKTVDCGVSKLRKIALICISDFCDKFSDQLFNDLDSEESTLHISLSKPFTLKHHEIDSFSDELRTVCRKFSRFAISAIQ